MNILIIGADAVECEVMLDRTHHLHLTSNHLGNHVEKMPSMPCNNTLPFADFSFDYALVDHAVFLSSDPVSVDNYVDNSLSIIQALARVSREVRVFPLVDEEGALSPLLGPVLLGLQRGNYGVEVCERASPASAAHVMLRVWAKQCLV